ncbi:hypothetical protein C8J56DRAFT_480790 [Mycena floridula]|nr:hypothetical protein C8J56DRAFT_480790 [Mycena floridula]
MTSLVKNVVQQWGSHSKPPSTPPIDLCEICGKKPKFIERGFKHAYCSRTCAAKSGQGPSPSSCVLQSCRLTGKPAFAGFCSELHAKEGVRLGQVKACEICQVQPQRNGDLCLTCERRSPPGPRLREVRKGGSTFNQVRAQFNSEWDSAGTSPNLEKVYEVTLPRDVRKRNESYRAAKKSPQELRAFHSSQVICDLGVKDAALCDFKSCGICSIVKSSFKAFAFGIPYNNGRYGDGIYSYRNPALADRFATSCTSSPYRVMLACDVVVDSKVEVSDTNSIFVPSADAIAPAFILMYTV